MPVAQGPAPVRRRLTGGLVSAQSITASDQYQMLRLMQGYYHNVTAERFEADLSEKDCVILARDPACGSVRGFSTQSLIKLSSGRSALFSGDTIIDRAYWGQNPLAQLWGRLALTLIEERPRQDLYWFLISKGYKTYRFLPVFFKEFFPRVNVPTPAWASSTLTELGQLRFPGRFDAERGIIRANQEDDFLRSDVARLDDRRRMNPDVEFFEQRNPGHAAGDELCCLAPLTRQNFKRGAFKVIGSPETLVLPNELSVTA